MSSSIVIAPLVIAGWPIITAAVTAAVSSMGFNIVTAGASSIPVIEEKKKIKIDMELEESEILNESVSGEQIVVEKGGIRAIFSRDERGALKLCVEGDSHSKSDLKQIGQELIDRVTQQYVYHKIVTELKQRNMAIVDEEVAEDRTVKIRVRNL